MIRKHKKMVKVLQRRRSEWANLKSGRTETKVAQRIEKGGYREPGSMKRT